MTKDILTLIESFTQFLNQKGMACSFRDFMKETSKTPDIGPKPILNLLGTNGIFSNSTCVFKSLNFEFIYPAIDLSLQAFMGFEETFEDLLSQFLSVNENLSLKYSPRFDVMVDKNLYRVMFTFDVFSMNMHYQM